MTTLDKYLEKYPQDRQDVMAAVYAWGEDKTEEVLSEALKKGKRVIFENSTEHLDLMTFRYE